MITGTVAETITILNDYVLSLLYIFVFNIWRNCDCVQISRGGFVFIQHLGVRQTKISTTRDKNA